MTRRGGVAAANYVVHLVPLPDSPKEGQRTLCGRDAELVNVGVEREHGEAICKPCRAKSVKHPVPANETPQQRNARIATLTRGRS